MTSPLRRARCRPCSRISISSTSTWNCCNRDGQRETTNKRLQNSFFLTSHRWLTRFPFFDSFFFLFFSFFFLLLFLHDSTRSNPTAVPVVSCRISRTSKSSKSRSHSSSSPPYCSSSRARSDSSIDCAWMRASKVWVASPSPNDTRHNSACTTCNSASDIRCASRTRYDA